MKSLLLLGVSAAVLFGCSNAPPQTYPVPSSPPPLIFSAPPATQPPAVVTAIPESTQGPASIGTPLPIASATPMGPFIPTGASPTPNPAPPLQSIERKGVPTFKWTPPPKRAPQSIVSANDSGGQAGIAFSAYAAPLEDLGLYARVSVVCPTLAPDPNGGLTTLYAPTLKAPNSAVELSFDAWAQSQADGGAMSCVLRLYDFAQRSGTDVGWDNTVSLDETDPAFQAKYLRIFPEEHGPQAEMETWGNSTYLANHQTGKWDRLYTSTGISPSREDGWYLLPETHYGAGVPCSPLPDMYVDAARIYMQYNQDPPGAWVTPSAQPFNYSNGSQVLYGDCFKASAPGAYYEFKLTAPPDFGSSKASSIGP